MDLLEIVVDDEILRIVFQHLSFQIKDMRNNIKARVEREKYTIYASDLLVRAILTDIA